MKIFKNILEQVLNKKDFFSFSQIDKIFLKIFSFYFDSVVFIKIKNRILFIGVKIPQLIAHFTSLKRHIIAQFLEEKSIDIIDIKFFYYNKPKNIVAIKKQTIKKNYIDTDINKHEVYMLIKKKCYKNDYHDILYKMYIKSCLYEKK